ncbi:hypothetical protein ACI65C_005053 [Semiaphis heraclei]
MDLACLSPIHFDDFNNGLPPNSLSALATMNEDKLEAFMLMASNKDILSNIDSDQVIKLLKNKSLIPRTNLTANHTTDEPNYSTRDQKQSKTEIVKPDLTPTIIIRVTT